MTVWLTLLGGLLAYTGCVLLFQGGARRARHKAVRVPQDQTVHVKSAGWALVAVSLIVLCVPHGLEMGITFWLTALAAAGIVSLLVSALIPRWHLISPLGVAGLSLAFALPALLLGGGAA